MSIGDINILHMLVAFCGGVLGAALGGLNAFILCGLAAVVGTLLTIIMGDTTFNSVVTWGPLLGPHVAFAGGVAGAAYAAKIKVLCSGRNVLVALFGFNSPIVLVVGGIFGVLGILVKSILEFVPDIGGVAWTNTIALSIVITTIFARLLFGQTGVFGSVPDGKNRWRMSRDETWQPWPSNPIQVFLVGLGVGLPAAYMVHVMPSATGLFFGFGAVSLIFFQYGAKIPDILHIALSAEIVAHGTGTIIWGVIFGLIAAFSTELFACLFLIHGDTHIDPPAMSLAIVYTVYALGHWIDIFQLLSIIPIVILIIGFLGLLFFHLLHRDRG